MIVIMLKVTIKHAGLLFLALVASIFLYVPVGAVDLTDNDSIGITATKPAPPPSVASSVSSPANGAVFTTSQVTVTGACTSGLLVKLFKNSVFGGSAQCNNGVYTIVTDLFSGTNEIFTRVVDDLDQSGPDSNVITVTFNDGAGGQNPINRVTLTSNFAKRGANPNEKLNWPINLAGGTAPYAISIDWGDGETSLQSLSIAGQFNIEHIYKNSGIYNVIVRAVDANDSTAYLQLVAIANGPLSQTSTGEPAKTSETVTRVLWQPVLVLIPIIIATFWLGKRYELKRIKKSIDAGREPF